MQRRLAMREIIIGCRFIVRYDLPTMKTPPKHSCLAAAHTVLAVLLFATGASAQISGINSGASSASIKFNDTGSSVPPAGTTNVTQSTGPWNGSLFSPLFPTDPTTLDFATGDIQASGAGVVYSVLPGNIQLSQVNATSGFALLIYSFTVEYTIASNLALQPTLYPNFLVSGTVGSSPGSFASVTGSINYYDVSNAAYVNGLLDTVNYNYFNGTPGSFANAPVNGVPVNGTTQLILAGANLTLVGSFTFTVDPSTISASAQMVPEPASGLLALLSLPLLLGHRRALRG